MVSTVVPLALYLAATPALEAPNALALERLSVPCSIGSWSGASGNFKGLTVSEGAPLALGGPACSVTDETFWDPETYICMTHLGESRATLYSRGPS